MQSVYYWLDFWPADYPLKRQEHAEDNPVGAYLTSHIGTCFFPYNLDLILKSAHFVTVDSWNNLVCLIQTTTINIDLQKPNRLNHYQENLHKMTSDW